MTFGMVNDQMAFAATTTFTNDIFGFADDSTETRTITVAADVDTTITDVNVKVDFEKEENNNCANPLDDGDAYAEEINMKLASPLGTTVNLVFDVDSPGMATYDSTTGSGRVVVTFDDSATALVGATNNGIPETGTFRPVEALSAFNDEDPLGDWIFTFGDVAGGDYLCFYQVDLEFTTPLSLASVENGGSGGSTFEYLTAPTFGLDHSTFKPIVDGGFAFNGESMDITDNHWMPFEEQKVKIGDMNSFSAKVYADRQLQVQEFLFGLPQVGEGHKAELGIEVFYDYNGDIKLVKVVQKTDVIDVNTLAVAHEKSKCQAGDVQERCDTTYLSMRFLEPLRDSIFAIKAIDYQKRVQITYLNDGFDISGDSLNPMKTKLIPGTEKYEGLIEITQTAKYSDIWVANDDREFEMNKYGTVTHTNPSYESDIDDGPIRDRMHSEFPKYKQEQIIKAQMILNLLCEHCIDESFGESDNVFAYDYTRYDNRDDRNQPILLSEELKAKQILDKMWEQRYPAMVFD